jgi:hypothetical protein
MVVNIKEHNGVVTGTLENSIIVARYYLSTKQIKLHGIAASSFDLIDAHINAQIDFVAKIKAEYF